MLQAFMPHTIGGRRAAALCVGERFEMLERVRVDRERVVEAARDESATASRSPNRLVVGPADCAAEREADRVASEALARSGRSGDLMLGQSRDTRVRRSASAPTRVADGGSGGELDRETTGRIRRASGTPMGPQTRSEMESAFGVDLSAVRLHTGLEAADLSRSLRARAFTSGSDIFFGAGEYRPATADGQRLLAHEVAHTLQQPGPQRVGAGVIRRAPYLSNADGLIYKDTTDDTLDLAFIGKVLPYSHVFVEYRVVAAIGRIVKNLLPRGGPIRNRDKPRERETPYSRPKTSRQSAGRSKSRKPGGVQLGDEWSAINDRVRGAITAREDEELRSRIVDALGDVYAWFGGDEWDKVTGNLKPNQLATVVMRIVESGPQSLPLGGGSRLPSPRGKLYVAPPMLRARVFEILGVLPKQQAAYENVEITGFADADQYLSTRDALLAGGANVYKLENPEAGTWMFYASEVTSTRSDNSRIQVAGRVYADDVFAGLDDQRDAALIGTISASYGNLRAVTADSGWVPGTEMTAACPREEGQAAAMGLWNALGAAAYANRFMGTQYDLGQNWEWLHVRGAQIGGETVGGNLVPGLYATNSCMIPFEAMIKNWSVAGPTTFWARFVATGGNGPFASGIELWIRAQGHPQLLDIPPTKLATFNPIAGKVVDKLAGEMIKRSTDRSVRV
jgi:hypothetical protein